MRVQFGRTAETEIGIRGASNINLCHFFQILLKSIKITTIGYLPFNSCDLVFLSLATKIDRNESAKRR